MLIFWFSIFFWFFSLNLLQMLLEMRHHMQFTRKTNQTFGKMIQLKLWLMSVVTAQSSTRRVFSKSF